ncbi:MAG: DUF4293 domain-containing protein [Chitinophagaceae bacterium]|nr:DUF4293 domain-containing protein [Chitinophagaceae bacterium]
MIQRIQSVWLLLAAIAVFLTLKFSFFSGINSKGIPGAVIGSTTFILLLTTIATGSLAMINIFLFKKRILQLRLCIFGILLQILLIFLYIREVKNYMQVTYSLTAVLHLVAIAAFFLAARGINKDEKLIKESNRLR